MDDSDTLVIGYGNSWRSDDGLGPAVASLIEEMKRPNVRVMAVQQLTPELAEPLSQVERALFIDASTAPQSAPVVIQTLQPDGEASPLAHACHPATLLALSRVLYHRSPRAWMLTIEGRSSDHGDRLTDVAQLHFSQAVLTISDWLQSPLAGFPVVEPTV